LFAENGATFGLKISNEKEKVASSAPTVSSLE